MIVLLFIPQTGMPIKVFFNKLISFSPSVVEEDERETLVTYDWPLLNDQRQQVNFINSEGKIVLINFWATWCPPCVAELPSLQNLYNQYGESIDFYFVTNEDPTTVTSFMNKREYDLPVFYGKETPPNLLDNTALPTTYLLDETGEIIIKKTGAATWDSETVKQTLDSLLK